MFPCDAAFPTCQLRVTITAFSKVGGGGLLWGREGVNAFVLGFGFRLKVVFKD